MIESLRNRWVKDIRRLRRSKGDRALLEGPHLVAEAIAAGIEIEYVLATPEALGGRAGELLAGLDAPVEAIAPAVLEKITDTDSPRDVVAVARLERRAAPDLPVADDGLYVFLVGVQDPGNLGAVARVAEAAGATALALAPESVHPNHPRALRGSAGSLLRLPVARDVDADELAARLAPIGAEWLALAPAADAELYSAPLVPPLVLALGAERGLDPTVEARCSRRLRIPMRPPVESLNVAVAAALVLYEIRFGRRPST